MNVILQERIIYIEVDIYVVVSLIIVYIHSYIPYYQQKVISRLNNKLNALSIFLALYRNDDKVKICVAFTNFRVLLFKTISIITRLISK